MNYMYFLAEAVRFELTNGCPLPVFKTGAIDHSATPPNAIALSLQATRSNLVTLIANALLIGDSTMARLANRLAEFSVFLLLQ